jgi:hypothetical protein
LRHPKADEAKREQHKLDIALLKAAGRPLVYIDESGFEVDSPRTHGYTPLGKRCVDKQNWQAKGRINAIGALVDKTLLTVSLFTGSINSDVFFAWTVQDLLPKVPPNAVIIMDNAAFHKREDILEAINEAGFDALFLPPYSPDLNPIEQKWNEAKSRRQKQRCDVQSLFQNNRL